MLSRDLARHVEQRRSLGFKCHSEHILLRGFVAFAERRGDTRVKSTRVLAWAAEAPSPEQRRNRLHTVRRSRAAVQAGPAVAVRRGRERRCGGRVAHQVKSRQLIGPLACVQMSR
jgi:hypothetical protein